MSDKNQYFRKFDSQGKNHALNDSVTKFITELICICLIIVRKKFYENQNGMKCLSDMRHFNHFAAKKALQKINYKASLCIKMKVK